MQIIVFVLSGDKRLPLSRVQAFFPERTLEAKDIEWQSVRREADIHACMRESKIKNDDVTFVTQSVTDATLSDYPLILLNRKDQVRVERVRNLMISFGYNSRRYRMTGFAFEIDRIMLPDGNIFTVRWWSHDPIPMPTMWISAKSVSPQQQLRVEVASEFTPAGALVP